MSRVAKQHVQIAGPLSRELGQAASRENWRQSERRAPDWRRFPRVSCDPLSVSRLAVLFLKRRPLETQWHSGPRESCIFRWLQAGELTLPPSADGKSLSAIDRTLLRKWRRTRLQ